MIYAVLHEGNKHTYETILHSAIPPSEHLADILGTGEVAVYTGRNGYVVRFVRYGEPDDEAFFRVVEDVKKQLAFYEQEWKKFQLMMQIWQEETQKREQKDDACS